MAVDISTLFDQIYTSAVDFMASKAGILVGEGQDLAMVLFLITATWLILQWMLTGDGASALTEGLVVLTKYSIVVLMLAGWLGVVGGSLQSITNDISQKITGAQTPSQALTIMVRSAAKLFSRENVESMATCKTVDMPDPNGAGGVTQTIECEGVQGRGAEPTFLDMLIHLPMVLFTMLLKLAAIIFMLMMIVAFVLVLMIAEVMFGAALVFGPILVPWLIWSRMEWLFDGWLRFTVAACFTKMVAFFLVGVTGGIVLAMRSLGDSIMGSATSGVDYLGTDEMAAAMIAVTSAIGAFLMWQAPQIAQALISGGAGASASGFGRGKMGQAASSMTGKVMKAPGLQNDARQAREWLANKAAQGRGDQK